MWLSVTPRAASGSGTVTRTATLAGLDAVDRRQDISFDRALVVLREIDLGPRKPARADGVQRALAARSRRTRAAPSRAGRRRRRAASSSSVEQARALARRTSRCRRSRRPPRPAGIVLDDVDDAAAADFAPSSPRRRAARRRRPGTRAAARPRGAPSPGRQQLRVEEHVAVHDYEAVIPAEVVPATANTGCWSARSASSRQSARPRAAGAAHAIGLAADDDDDVVDAG